MQIVKGTSARLLKVPAGAMVAVRAIGARGIEGWDWARARPVD